MKSKITQPEKVDPATLKRIIPIISKGKLKVTGKNPIYVSAPDITKNEIESVTLAIKSGWVSRNGPYVKKFEEIFAKEVSGTKYALSTNSGSSAVHLALLALGVRKGDEVIMPTFTMIATANAVAFTGAKPVLVDADPITWNIDPGKIEAKITKKTRAILAVHIYGLTCDMQSIKNLAKKYDLWVVEDAAEAHGAEYKGKKAGNLGDVAAFSFYANKMITTGEGGIITTNNAQIARNVIQYRSNGFGEKIHFWHEYQGYGSGMSNLDAALGFAQTLRFGELLKKRRVNAAYYRQLLRKAKYLNFPAEPRGYKNAYWMFGVVVDPEKAGMSTFNIVQALAEQGVETRSFFIPIHLQPIYYKNYRGQKFVVSEKLCKDGFYLPSSGIYGKKEIERVCSTLRRIVESN